MGWRPDTDWPKCPCDDCTAEHKLVDEWGYFCDMVCGKRTAWIQREAGADAILEALKKEGQYERFQHIPGVKTVAIPYFYEGVAHSGHLVFIPEEE